MRFNLNNYSEPQSYTRSYSGFLGLDYTNAKLDINPKRSPDMQNFVHKDGINQKRNGYSQVLKIDSEGNFNGFWEFVDNNKNVHRIAHVGKKFYTVNFGKDVYHNTYQELKITYRPQAIGEGEWGEYLYGIKDQRSYGVIRGNRLYILCGIFLVYGSWDDGETWELRAVRENEDTYIPTTTTNIRHNGSTATSTRASLEEINMMTYFRKNKMYGEDGSGIVFDNYQVNDPGLEFNNTIVKGFQFSKKPDEDISQLSFSIYSKDDNYYGDIVVKLKKDGLGHFLNYDSQDVTIVGADALAGSVVRNSCPAFSFNYTYNDNNLDIKVLFGFTYEEIPNADGTTTLQPMAKVSSFIANGSFIYQLDGTNIYMAYSPILKINLNNEEFVFNSWNMSKENIYNPRLTDGTLNTLIELDAKNGILSIQGNHKNTLDPNPNIEITFATQAAVDNKSYKKIDGCTTGIIFGYNGIEHLFVTGNEDYPNMDWHTTESFLTDDNNTLPNSQNLTYFGELNYAYVGNTQTKIMSYSLLNDNTLGILKEFSPTESSLYIREPYLMDALDPSGNKVLDFNGDAYQKLYYKQYMSAIGEGCISQYATSNLAGEKIFLSENGVYEITLDLSNVISNQRYAREKSRLINPVLEKFGKDQLKNATGISYQNRYYLSIGDEEGTVFIADARFRSSDASEMNDTMGYEWWKWINVPAYIWYIDLEGNLCFGTKDGRLFSFNDEKSFKDREIIRIKNGGITYDADLQKFSINKNYDIKEGSKIKFITDLEEFLFDDSIIESIDENNYIKLKDDLIFDNYIEYLENKNINIHGDNELKAVITDLDSDNRKFKIKYRNIDVPVIIESPMIFTKDLDYELIANYDKEKNDFKLLSYNGLEIINLYGNVYNIEKDLQAFIVNDYPVIAHWYTPFINFDNSDFSKTLKYVTIIPEKVEHGKARVKIFSKTKSKEFGAFNVQGVDYDTLFDNLNFESLSLEIEDFAHSFSKKIKIRNFNFLMLQFISEDDKNFAIQEFTLTYVVSKRNKGVK